MAGDILLIVPNSFFLNMPTYIGFIINLTKGKHFIQILENIQ